MQVDNCVGILLAGVRHQDPEHQGRRRPARWCPARTTGGCAPLGNGKTSGWANGSFTVAPVTTPIPLAPANGAMLAQPQSPPLLQWSSSQGAVSYTIEVDGDSDLLGAKIYTTRTTSFVVTDPLTIGDWYWRVTANKDAGLTSLPSAVTRFDIQAAPGPADHLPGQRRQPGDRGRRPRLDAGARRAQLRRAGGARRRTSTTSPTAITNVTGTRGSRRRPPWPTTSSGGGSAPSTSAGQPTPWTESRQRLPAPVARPARSRCTRSGTSSSGPYTTVSPSTSGRPCSTPRYYELYVVAPTRNFSTGSQQVCRSLRHDATCRASPATAASPSGVDLCWEVRAMDDPTRQRPPGHLLGSRRPSSGRTRPAPAAPST